MFPTQSLRLVRMGRENPTRGVPHTSDPMMEDATLTTQLLSARERHYLRSLRKRERNSIVSLLEQHKRTCPDREVPLRLRVLRSTLPEATRMRIFNELDSAGASDKYMTWVEKALQLPLQTVHSPGYANSGVPLQQALRRAREIMDASITGHHVAKREVLKFICSARSTQNETYALGLEGPAGCGKTNFVHMAMVPALQRPLVSIPLGGAKDANYLLGSAYTYEGSKEGRLATALVEARCVNPIVFFDEVDKCGPEIESVLIHLVDPAVPILRDRYFHGIDIDFSKCTFVFCYNDARAVNPILLDRIKRITMSAPTPEEREQIVRKHLVPRVQKRLGMTDTSLGDGAVDAVVRLASQGDGMRDVERGVDHVLTSVQLCRALNNDATAAGVPRDVAVTCARGAITEAFAEAVLSTIQVHDRGKAPPPPPCMYT